MDEITTTYRMRAPAVCAPPSAPVPQTPNASSAWRFDDATLPAPCGYRLGWFRHRVAVVHRYRPHRPAQCAQQTPAKRTHITHSCRVTSSDIVSSMKRAWTSPSQCMKGLNTPAKALDIAMRKMYKLLHRYTSAYKIYNYTCVNLPTTSFGQDTFFEICSMFLYVTFQKMKTWLCSCTCSQESLWNVRGMVKTLW